MEDVYEERLKNYKIYRVRTVIASAIFHPEKFATISGFFILMKIYFYFIMYKREIK